MTYYGQALRHMGQHYKNSHQSVNCSFSLKRYDPTDLETPFNRPDNLYGGSYGRRPLISQTRSSEVTETPMQSGLGVAHCFICFSQYLHYFIEVLHQIGIIVIADKSRRFNEQTCVCLIIIFPAVGSGPNFTWPLSYLMSRPAFSSAVTPKKSYPTSFYHPVATPVRHEKWVSKMRQDRGFMKTCTMDLQNCSREGLLRIKTA